MAKAASRQGRQFHSWRLFFVLALALSVLNCAELSRLDFHSSRGIEAVIIFSVRCALPLFIIAFVASSLQVIWPSTQARWLLASRRYFGLAFAFGMGWHLLFVTYSIYLFGIKLNTPVLAADVIGAAFLLALTATSFKLVSRHMLRRHWVRLHKMGMYAIWLLTIYIYQASARADRDLLHILILAILFAAWIVRLLAWTKVRFLG